MPDICGIIPARGGSKGFPRKNVQLLRGIPLIAHTILAARNAASLARFVVTTEDPEIRRISLDFGAEVIDRPPQPASDTATSQEVVLHALEYLRSPEHFALLQPTSPQRTAAHIDECVRQYLESAARCAISVTACEHHPYKSFLLERNCLRPLHDRHSLHLPRQALPPVVRQNGAIYLMSTELFLRERTFFVEPVMPFRMSAACSIDIDSAFDLWIAEHGAYA